MFCEQCGKQLSDTAQFCGGCGARVESAAAPAQSGMQYGAPQPMMQNAGSRPHMQYGAPQPMMQYGAPQPGMQFTGAQQGMQYGAPQQQYAPPVRENSFSGSGPRFGIPAPGFSDRAYDPEILRALKRNRSIGRIFMFIVIPIPLIVAVLISVIGGELDMKTALAAGGCISAIFLIVNLISLGQSNPRNSYEAVVIDKKSRRRYDRSNSDSGTSDSYTEFLTIVKTTDGRQKTITESDRNGSSDRKMFAWNHLVVGDSFRYHPHFAYPYELYDKSRLREIGCVVCGRKNPLENDRCSKCNAPLLK
ncbi:MAG: zinc-ribbon domain-containing protein [Lachnospiraceae bacterium]|nr:zinc-ribbon domain-containing protein [Lachnospiraceae bacterium]